MPSWEAEHIDKVINIDQSPIGRTPRSNPATYTGAFVHPGAFLRRSRKPGCEDTDPVDFPLTSKAGVARLATEKVFNEIEMQFLPDVTVPCEICKGSRYNREALEIKFKGKNIAEVLDLTVEQALIFFEHFPAIHRKMVTLRDVG